MMLPRDEAALALYQANRNSPEIESLMDAFFNFPTREEYDRTLSRVSEEMGKCVIFISDLPPSLSAVL